MKTFTAIALLLCLGAAAGAAVLEERTFNKDDARFSEKRGLEDSELLENAADFEDYSDFKAADEMGSYGLNKRSELEIDADMDMDKAERKRGLEAADEMGSYGLNKRSELESDADMDMEDSYGKRGLEAADEMGSYGLNKRSELEIDADMDMEDSYGKRGLDVRRSLSTTNALAKKGGYCINYHWGYSCTRRIRCYRRHNHRRRTCLVRRKKCVRHICYHRYRRCRFFFWGCRYYTRSYYCNSCSVKYFWKNY